jgi:hypothetical protein
MNALRSVVASVAFATILLLTRRSFAQEPVSSAPVVPADEACLVERAVGLTDAEAAAVDEVMCGVIRASAPTTRHRVRVARLGAKVVVTLDNGTSSPKQLVLSSLDELSVAAPRLTLAAQDARPVAETVDVTNVVGDDERTLKKKSAEIHCLLDKPRYPPCVRRRIGRSRHLARTRGSRAARRDGARLSSGQDRVLADRRQNHHRQTPGVGALSTLASLRVVDKRSTSVPLGTCRPGTWRQCWSARATGW